MSKNEVQLWVLNPVEGWILLGFFNDYEAADKYWRELPPDNQGVKDFRFVLTTTIHEE